MRRQKDLKHLLKQTTKTLKKSIYLIFVFIFLIPFQGATQEKDKEIRRNDTLVGVAKEIILSSATCTLITLDDKGQPRARIMETLGPDHNFTIWFGTNPKSRKVLQIKNDSRVTLLYNDQDNSGYVTLYGEAEIVNDPKEKEERWKEEWAAFYEDRQDGFVLIKFSPDWMEVVSNSRNIMGDSVTWKPQRVSFDKKKQ